jgi:hypothetical protein
MPNPNNRANALGLVCALANGYADDTATVSAIASVFVCDLAYASDIDRASVFAHF